jgi:hypothetical protein
MFKAYMNKMNGNTKYYEFNDMKDLKKQIDNIENLTKPIITIEDIIELSKNNYYYQLYINTDKIYDSRLDNKYEFTLDIIYNITLILIRDPIRLNEELIFIFYSYGHFYNIYKRESNETSPEQVIMKGKRIGCFQETEDNDKFNITYKLSLKSSSFGVIFTYCSLTTL